MIHLQMLASSARPLAEVLVDALRAHTKLRLPKLQKGSSNAVYEPPQFDLRNVDDFQDPEDTAEINILRPDEVAVAWLLGRALDGQRDALARMQDADAVSVIEVPNQDFVDHVERLLKMHVITGAQTLDGDGLGKDYTIAAPHTVAIFMRKDEDKPKTSKSSENGNAEFAVAALRRCAVTGIADRLLPPNLVRMAEHRFVVPPLDASAVAAVIEAVTGRRPGTIDDELARRTTLEALNIAVRADLGAERSLARLTCLLGSQAANAEPAPRLCELHGLGPVKDWALALIRDLTEYAAGRLPWVAVDRGLLVTGAAGVGKTALARSVAREAQVHFVSTSYSQWQSHREGHLGHVTQAIRNVFAEARRNSPSILFIDEIDTIPARGTGKWNDDWWTSITNTLLECMDGFERREGVVIIAACNDPSRLDPALVRSGRLDRHIEIKLPDVPALIGICRTHLGSELAGADLRAVALAARGHTGADIERWVRQARRVARIAGRALELPDLLDAVRGGKPEWPADVRKRVGYHEAGHAIAVLALGIAEPKALSIGGTGGLAENDVGEIRAQTRSHLETTLVALLAGRAAEQIVFGEATAGAGGEDSDLSRATQLAMRLETHYGLGTFGLVCVAGDTNSRDLLLLDSLRSAVGRTIDRAYAAALDLLGQNRRALDALAGALFDAGYLDRGEIAAVLAQTPLSTKMTTDAPAVQAAQQSEKLPRLGESDIAMAEPPGKPLEEKNPQCCE
jgi:hypothetical protein